MPDSVHMLNMKFYKQQGTGVTKVDVTCDFDNCEIADLSYIAATTAGAMAKALLGKLPEKALQGASLHIVDLVAAFWLDTVCKAYVEVTNALLQGKPSEEQKELLLVFIQVLRRLDYTGSAQAYSLKVRKGPTMGKEK